jgi:hypothetical protein
MGICPLPFLAYLKHLIGNGRIARYQRRSTPVTKASSSRSDPWPMTNPKRSERNTKKNPWYMVNPNYKFGKSLLSDDDHKTMVAPCTRDLLTFYKECAMLDDEYQL